MPLSKEDQELVKYLAEYIDQEIADAEDPLTVDYLAEVISNAIDAFRGGAR